MQFILGFALALIMVSIFFLGAFYGIYITEKEYKRRDDKTPCYFDKKVEDEN